MNEKKALDVLKEMSWITVWATLLNAVCLLRF